MWTRVFYCTSLGLFVSRAARLFASAWLGLAPDEHKNTKSYKQDSRVFIITCAAEPETAEVEPERLLNLWRREKVWWDMSEHRQPCRYQLSWQSRILIVDQGKRERVAWRMLLTTESQSAAAAVGAIFCLLSLSDWMHLPQLPLPACGCPKALWDRYRLQILPVVSTLPPRFAHCYSRSVTYSKAGKSDVLPWNTWKETVWELQWHEQHKEQLVCWDEGHRLEHVVAAAQYKNKSIVLSICIAMLQLRLWKPRPLRWMWVKKVRVPLSKAICSQVPPEKQPTDQSADDLNSFQHYKGESTEPGSTAYQSFTARNLLVLTWMSFMVLYHHYLNLY